MIENVNSGYAAALRLGCFTVYDFAYESNANMAINGEALPVELISFAASDNYNEVTLSWQTATEVNNYGFEIERSINLRGFNGGESEPNPGGFTSIGFIEGNGNSNSLKRYSYIDYDYEQDYEIQYRLKQIDTDGSFCYSKEIEVKAKAEEMPTEFALYQNCPNPFNPTTTIMFAVPTVETHRDASLQHVTLKVYDVLGNEVATLVNEAKEPGIYEVEFNASQSASGVYFYKLSAGNFVSVKKLMLLK